MRVHFTNDVEAYAAAVTPFLERDPVRCTVPLSVIEYARSGLVDEATWSWIVDGDGNVVGTASWIPPHYLLLSPMSAEAVHAVTSAWAPRPAQPAGVNGPRPVAETCARDLAAQRGMRARETFAERLFRLDAVTDPEDPAGSARRATAQDLDLGTAWMHAFIAETGVVGSDDQRRNMAASIAQGRLWLWQDGGEVVALVGTSPSVARVSRVGPVYTPPEHRGHGYARSLVAAVSRQRLAAGDTACCLFTDLANPVSNQIYQQVGYRPVDDFAQITFEPH